MSAICGIYSRFKNVSEYRLDAMMSGFERYRFDTSGFWKNEAIFLGNHFKQVTPGVDEGKPVLSDSEALLTITADAILDNRDDLLAALSIPREKRDLSDAALILEAYKKWGSGCPEYLVGDFAFALWNERKKELFCSRDHTGKRTFYYCSASGVFAFSTLINPLFLADAADKALNEVYIADFLTLPQVSHEIDPELTIYKSVFQLPPAHSMLITEKDVRKWQYWDIGKTSELRYPSDEEYEQAFLEIFGEAVRCRLRTANNAGIYMSSGLDSGAAACFAAPQLQKENKKLFAFTQVPLPHFETRLPQNKLADETPWLEEYPEKYENMVLIKVLSEGRSPLTEIDEQLATLEQPYKTFENSYWMNEILRQASRYNIDILIDGQSGNATISWGSYYPYLKYLIQNGDITTYYKEITAYAALHRRNRLKMFLHSTYLFMPYSIKKMVFFMRGGRNPFDSLSPINANFYKEMDEARRLKRFNMDVLFLDTGDCLRQRLKMLNTAAFSHIGCLETKLPMSMGITRRDPSRDKRVIEFCMNLPENQYVRDGAERRFIRQAMKGRMPDKIRLNTTVRGQQAADWQDRIEPDWQKTAEEIETIGVNPLEKRYLNIEKIKKHAALTKQKVAGNKRMLIRALIFSRFLRKNGF